MNYLYRKASLDDLEKIWIKNIADNYGDERWVKWKAEAIANNVENKSSTFVVLHQNDPIGEGTLLFSPSCNAIRNRIELCDGERIANINALRIQKAYENKGHISELMKQMEEYAVSLGYSHLTIGVEAKETRNLGIYLHWGYNEFVMSEAEDGELILYYQKKLK